MRVDLSCFADPQANLNYDDQLLREAETGAGEVMHFWESSSYFVVLGRTGKEEEDVNIDAVTTDRIPVLRRSSGGGTVLQGPGCLNFSVILSKKERPVLESISGSYVYILERVVNALRELGVAAVFRPICDLALEPTQQKFSGNAQRRGRQYILHHGTILYAFDLERISKYLRMPCKMPEYRQARPHADFIANISLRPEAIRQAIIRHFS
ncbi:MAG: lipoate--protein ligase family protein [Candidatus Omnitrophica bacterium]|nr:lipoate--protein ligase family protein [Candidatus Omnitrophota bacterium]